MYTHALPYGAPPYYADDVRVIERYRTGKKPVTQGPFFVVKMGHRPGLYRKRHIAQRMTENFPDTTPSSWDTKQEALAWLYSPYLHELIFQRDPYPKKRVVYCAEAIQDVQSGRMAGLGCYFGQSNECNFSGPLVGLVQDRLRASFASVLQALKIIWYRREHYPWQIRCTTNIFPSAFERMVGLWKTREWHNTLIVPEEGRDLLSEIMKLLDLFVVPVEITYMLDHEPAHKISHDVNAAEKLAQGGIYEPVFYLPEGN